MDFNNREDMITLLKILRYPRELEHYSISVIHFFVMRSWVLFFLICCSVAFCKYSYTDKCYRFEKVHDKQCSYYDVISH